MPLDRIVLWLLKGLRTLVLVWVGLLTFALFLSVTGLREAPGPSEFTELRHRLELRVSAPAVSVPADETIRFDNFAVAVYLVPIFLMRWICGFAAYRRISAAAVLAGLLVLAFGSVAVGDWLIRSGALPAMEMPPSTTAVSAALFGSALMIPLLIASLLTLVTRRPGQTFGRLFAIPGAVDRCLRHLFDPHSGRLGARIGPRLAYLSNGMLLATLAVPSAIVIWSMCDWLDGRGVSDFALVTRAAVVLLCLAMLARAHLRSYRIGEPAHTE